MSAQPITQRAVVALTQWSVPSCLDNKAGFSSSPESGTGTSETEDDKPGPSQAPTGPLPGPFSGLGLASKLYIEEIEKKETISIYPAFNLRHHIRDDGQG